VEIGLVFLTLIYVLRCKPNKEETVFRSKAVGEPPLMLGISVFNAINNAVASIANYRVTPQLDAPATPERVLMACEKVRNLGEAYA
jgi:xanthine dehydrogenase large subunit